jgi:hypothetical protein
MARHAERLAIVLALFLYASPGQARLFEIGEVEGVANLELSYGLLARVQDRDPDLIAIVNGGSSQSANWDDGDLNYDRGIVSNMLQASGELALRWRSLGAYVRGIAFYDFESELSDRERTPLSDKADHYVGANGELREYYVSGQFRLGGMPVQVRLGDQVLNWGESTFLRFGAQVENPLDFVALFRPASATRDVQIPQGMLWAAANLTTELAVEGYYQYSWERVHTSPLGWFFSAGDAFGSDGMGAAMLGGGRFSDLGTDLDAAFGLPAGTLGFDRNFMRIPGKGSHEPSDQGQFGFTVQAILPRFNSTKLALHFVNYHSRLPVLNSRTADAAAVAATSPAAVAARAAALAPIYEGEGLPPAEAAAAASAAASTLTVGEYASEASYSVTYPENVRMLALSFNTATPHTGTLVSGEVAHHFGVPLQILPADVFTAALSPIEFDPSFAQGPLGAFGPGEDIRGWIRRDKTQIELGVRQLLGPRLGAAQSLVGLDVGYVHVYGMPPDGRLRLAAPGITGPQDYDHLADADAWGYRVSAALSYEGVLGAFTVQPHVVWVHDVQGTTPDSIGAFVERRKTLGVGFSVDYTNTWLLELDYTNFFGAGRFNLVNDRDFLRFRLTYFY